MTGILENPPGVGHNQPAAEGAEKENQHWERWAKKRTFVRALEGTYSHLYKQLIDQPRVFSSKDVPWKGGPGHYGKSVISPQAVNITQSIESHIEAYAPGASGQKHGHLNSAVFYVLKGRGHDMHDGRHIPWKAGDVMIVENGCVHQHFNDIRRTRRRSCWCSRRSRCSCSCTCCSRRSWNGRRRFRPRARRTTSRRRDI